MDEGKNKTSKKKHRFKLTKKHLVSALVVVLVLAGAAGLGILGQYLMSINNQTQNNTPVSGLPAAVDEIQNLRLQGNSEEANKKTDEALADPNQTEEMRQMLYMQKGHSAMSASDFEAAVDAYSQAAAIYPDPEIYRVLGEAYFLSGNKTEARAAYEKALAAISPNIPSEGIKRDLQQRIDFIDGKFDPEAQ